MKPLLKHKTKTLIGIAVVILAILIGRTFHLDLAAPDLERKYATGASRFVELSPVLRVHYRDEGPRQAPVLVLIHGTASSLHTFDDLTRELREEFRVIRFDLPGFGLTGPCDDDRCDYSPEEDAEFVRRLLQSLGILQPVAIAGNSLGGRIGWEFALRYPEQTSALVLIDALGYDWPAKPMAITMARVPFVKYLQRYVTPYFLIRRSLHEVYGDDDLVSEELIDRHFELLLREGNRAAFIARVNHELDADGRRIKELRLPVLIAWGAADAWIPVDHARLFQRDIPGARLVLYEGVGHVPHEEAPARVARDMARFLRAAVR
ncbi:MAG: alpha/beta hydrolase [Leptospirales bacterium]|jgi:pimeloyl-ACP methyl ester carboxylesterase